MISGVRLAHSACLRLPMDEDNRKLLHCSALRYQALDVHLVLVDVHASAILLARLGIAFEFGQTQWSSFVYINVFSADIEVASRCSYFMTLACGFVRSTFRASRTRDEQGQ